MVMMLIVAALPCSCVHRDISLPLCHWQRRSLGSQNRDLLVIALRILTKFAGGPHSLMSASVIAGRVVMPSTSVAKRGLFWYWSLIITRYRSTASAKVLNRYVA
jgi:hypothetical protein